MHYHSISINPIYKAIELQWEKTLIELASGPYFFFIKSICLIGMNMFARFDKITTVLLQDIKKTKRYRWTWTPFRITKRNNSNRIGPWPLLFLLKVFVLETEYVCKV